MSERDTEISRGIIVNPGRCSGSPTIKGTRISAFMVARLLSGETALTPYEIIDNYPELTYHDLANVRGWMRRWIS